MTPAEILTGVGALLTGLALLVTAVTGLVKELRRRPKKKRK